MIKKSLPSSKLDDTDILYVLLFPFKEPYPYCDLAIEGWGSFFVREQF